MATNMLIVVAAVAVFAAAVEGSLEPGLRVKFEMGTSPNDGTEYFFNISRTISEAKEAGWKRVHRPRDPPQPLPQLSLYCAQDKILCAFFDDLQDVAGLQVCLPEAQFSGNLFDWKKRGFQRWSTSINDECVNLWCIQQYFVSEEYLQKSKEERLELRDPELLLQEKAIWLVGNGRELIKITNEAQIVEEGLFTKQACIPWMGQHYYYKMSKSSVCDDEGMYPWFPMTMDGELVASGYSNFGSLPVGSPDWFERPSREVVEMIVPEGPECLYELADNPTALTMHIYYTKTPWLIAC